MICITMLLTSMKLGIPTYSPISFKMAVLQPRDDRSLPLHNPRRKQASTSFVQD
jgi:hypothetical protein